MNMRKIIAAVAASVIAVSALATSAFAATAYLGFATGPDAYAFRNAWDDTTYGKSTDYYNSVIVWGDSNTDPDTFGDDYSDYFDYDIAAYAVPANYTDVSIAADGTYKIAADGFDWSIDNSTCFNSLYISTDIPMGSGAKFSDVKLYVDGELVTTIAEPVAETTGTYEKINIVNIWNTDVAPLTDVFPKESIEVEFTVSGLGAAVGNTDVATDGSSKDAADTGIEGVAAIAGLALVATGAIIVAKKRK